EAGTSEVPPIAAFESPVLVTGEVDVERDRSVGATGAYTNGGLVGIARGPYEVEDRFGPRARSVPSTDFEHRDPAVHFIERRLVEVDWLAARRCSLRRLDHLAAELIVDAELHGDRGPMPEIIRWWEGRGRRGLRGRGG